MTLTEFMYEALGRQRSLAQYLGVSPGLVSMWVSGTRRVSAHHCHAIHTWSGKKVRLEELRPDVFVPKKAA